MSKRQKLTPALVARMGQRQRDFYAEQLCKTPWKTEDELQALAEDLLMVNGIWFFHMSQPGTFFNRGGIPDLLCCIGGRFIAFELKATKGWVSDKQRACHQAIVESGGEVHVIRRMGELKLILDNILAGKKEVSFLRGG